MYYYLKNGDIITGDCQFYTVAGWRPLNPTSYIGISYRRDRHRRLRRPASKKQRLMKLF